MQLSLVLQCWLFIFCFAALLIRIYTFWPRGHVQTFSFFNFITMSCVCLHTGACMRAKVRHPASLFKKKKTLKETQLVASLITTTHPKATSQGEHCDAFTTFRGFGRWKSPPHSPSSAYLCSCTSVTRHHTRGGGEGRGGGSGGGGGELHVTPPMSPWLRPHIICRVHSPNDDSQRTVMWFPGLFILWKPTKSSIGW